MFGAVPGLVTLIGIVAVKLLRRARLAVDASDAGGWRRIVALEQTSLPISKVALHVGYSEPSQLAVAFRRSFGISPTRYRAEHGS